ncbi:uncharacterized protein LOC112533256 isoform X2 [Gallus gallus]|uniref:uncharacterized protein LOC112533256 isoform X2 n=1 Tax=Gallus gallus TaxID=9031 RepID=UPI001F007D75|nr:uncharacterized protein LOC112533256 isoform X2 [Gallus gallus]
MPLSWKDKSTHLWQDLLGNTDCTEPCHQIDADMHAAKPILSFSASFFFSLLPFSAILRSQIEASLSYDGVKLHLCAQEEPSESLSLVNLKLSSGFQLPGGRFSYLHDTTAHHNRAVTVQTLAQGVVCIQNQNNSSLLEFKRDFQAGRNSACTCVCDAIASITLL